MTMVNSGLKGLMVFCLNPFSAGIDFSRQILTTKVYPRTVGVKIFLMVVDT